MSKAEIFVTKVNGNHFASNENYQMVNLLWRLHVSEQTSDPIGDLIAGSINAGPDVSIASEAKLRQAAPRSIDIEAPKLVPESGRAAEAPKDASKAEPTPAPKAELKPAPRAELKSAPKVEPKLAPKVEPKPAPKVEAAKTDAPRATGKVTIMAPSHDDTRHQTGEAPSDQDARTADMFGKRRLAALAAVMVLAGAAGAIGGALATAALGHFNGSDQTKMASVQNHELEDSIARIDADLAALKQLGVAQAAKVNDRLDKVEKAQAEPAAKLIKLSEAVEKLRAAPLPAPVASAPAARETTGSIQPPASTPKPEIARLPTVESWVLRDVANGGALIEGRQGVFEVFAGDAVPGLGRVDAIRRQDGHWVVVTTKGLIVAR
jgi:hypothetical protein